MHASSPAHAGPAWPLVAAAWLAAIEAVVLGMVVVGRGRPLAAVWFVVKLVLCVRVVGRRAGAFLGLVLYEAVTVLIALVATGTPIGLRVLAGASALTVLVLLGRSARLFPSPTLPRP